MKMHKDHFDQLEKLIKPLDTVERRLRYLTGEFPNASKVKNLDMRYRWDLFYAAIPSCNKLTDNLYSYLTDDHIDTALKAIVKPLDTEQE